MSVTLWLLALIKSGANHQIHRPIVFRFIPGQLSSTLTSILIQYQGLVKTGLNYVNYLRRTPLLVWSPRAVAQFRWRVPLVR